MTQDLMPVLDAVGRVCEPGHHYEWVWRLRQFQCAGGRNVDVFCSSLYDHADRHGWDAQGFIIDEVDAGGADQAVAALLAACRRI
jgi:mannose/cellobiose epimerase-like protein (N-acyl-D-glucosamine 2-epimerase family)